MAAIKKKNILNVSTRKNYVIWGELRDDVEGVKVTVGDLFPVPLIGKWSVSAKGVLAFLIGDDPLSR